MIECLILGDSLAVGIQQQRPECVTYSRVGLNTMQWNKKFLGNNLSAETVVISLGTNDHVGIRTKAELQRVREKVGTKSKVYWILPLINDEVQAAVKNIAKEYNDIVLTVPDTEKKGIHPTNIGYKTLANQTKG